MSLYGNRDGKFKVKKLEVRDGVPVVYSIPKLSNISTSAIFAGWDVDAEGTASRFATAFAVQPPYPVNISLTAVVAGTAAHADTVTIKGYDATGNYIEESIFVAATTFTTSYTEKSFSRVTEVTPDSALHKSTDVNIGWGSALGLPWPISSTGDIITYNLGSTYATTADYALDLPNNRIRPETLTVDESLLIVYRSPFQ